MTAIDWLTHAGAWTLRNSLETCLLFLLVWLLVTLGKNRLAPQVRIALWVAVGLRLFLPAAPESKWSLYNLLPADAQISQVVSQTPVSVFESEDSTRPVSVSGRQPSSPYWIFFLLWLAVFWGLLAYVLISQIRMSRWIKTLKPVSDAWLQSLAEESGIPSRIQITEVPAGQGVAVFGLFQVTHLLVPADFQQRYSSAEMQGILRHEAGHIHGKDLLWSWLILLVQCWHWFNPLVWFAGSRIQAEREIICDRAALHNQPESNRPLYGAALTKALEHAPIPEATLPLQTFLSRKNEMKNRLHLIMKKQNYQILPQIGAIALTLALCVTTFTSALPSTALADNNKPKPEGKGKPAKIPVANTKNGKIFGAYDKDHDGFVTAKEMEAMMEGKQNSSGRRQLRKAVKRADKNDDNKLDLSEFVWWMKVGRRNAKAENE